MATIPPDPHYISDRDDGNDIAAALSDPDSMWIVRPQMFFSCTVRPLTSRVDRYNNPPDDIPLDLVFFSAFQVLHLQFTGTMEFNRIRKLYEPSPVPALYVGLVEDLLGRVPLFSCFLDGTPPQFHSSTLLDRDETSHSAVLPVTDIMMGPKRAEAAMCMRSTPGCGTLDGPSLVLPVSLLLKQRRSARGAGLLPQRKPGRPGWPASVLLSLRLMQTYDMYIPCLSYTCHIHLISER